MAGQWQVGTLLENTRTGQRRRITRVTPAGAAATSFASGPTFHATLVDAEGTPIPRGHTAEIWSGSVVYPARQWVPVEEGQ